MYVHRVSLVAKEGVVKASVAFTTRFRKFDLALVGDIHLFPTTGAGRTICPITTHNSVVLTAADSLMPGAASTFSQQFR